MLKVFLVEDESLIREGLRDNIPWEQYGYRFVGEAGDGEMALPLIRKSRPDLLITDIKMPFMDGLSLSKIVKEEFPKTKVVIISGYDDFEYAREAIEVGVDQYLLKPITRMNLRKVLLEMKEKIENETEPEDYKVQLQNEMREYEQFSRRRFFEQVLEGKWSVKQIYEEAAKCSLELSASCYNLMFLYMQEKSSNGISDYLMEQFFSIQDKVLHYFLRYPQYILFRWNVNCYGILVKSENADIQVMTEKAIEYVRQVCSEAEEYLTWYIATGNPVERLSLLPQCYQSANHYFAYRFIFPALHVYDESTMTEHLPSSEDHEIHYIDSAQMNPKIIQDFLEEGSSNEVHDFVESYLQRIKGALKSNTFRGYVVLNIRFAAIEYIESIGRSREELLGRMEKYAEEIHIELNDVFDYFVEIFQAAISIREEENNNQGSMTLRRVLDYINEHYTKEDLSLGSVAAAVDVSANYLSSVFSQNMQKTFTEYVTEKRMEKAKKLLRNSEDSTGKIASEVGYKDAHYFSYVFKKTQGLSPREYRSGK